MSRYLDKAKQLRAITEIHYNCAQSVIVPFADVIGMDEDMAYRMGANFGGGMKMGSVCGAVTGALMVLGLAGLKGPEVTDAYYGKFRERHGDMINCADLLRAGAERGEQKLPWCNALIRECIGYVEEALREQGKL